MASCALLVLEKPVTGNSLAQEGPGAWLESRPNALLAPLEQWSVQSQLRKAAHCVLLGTTAPQARPTSWLTPVLVVHSAGRVWPCQCVLRTPTMTPCSEGPSLTAADVVRECSVEWPLLTRELLVRRTHGAELDSGDTVLEVPSVDTRQERRVLTSACSALPAITAPDLPVLLLQRCLLLRQLATTRP